MTPIKRFRISLLTAVLFLFLLGFSAGAAVKVNPVTNVTVSSYKTTAFLSWKKLVSPDGYELAIVNKSGKIIDTKIVKSNSIALKNLKSGSTYRFKIRGFKIKTTSTPVGDGLTEDVEKTYYGEYSPVVTCKITSTSLAAPDYLKVDSQGSRSVKLTWGRVSKGNGYVLEAKEKGSSADFAIVFTSKSYNDKTANLKNLKAGTTYTFRARAYKKSGSQLLLGAPSKTVNVKIFELSGEVAKIRVPRYVGTTKVNMTLKNSKGKSVTIKKGTTIYTTSRLQTTATGYLKDGTKFNSVPTKNIKFTALDCNPSNDYSKTAKEQWVNMKAYSSNSKYFVWINQLKLRVNIFEGSRGKWKLIKTYPCCVGRFDYRTSSGMHKVLKKIPYDEYGGQRLFFTTGVDKGGTAANPQGCAFHKQLGTDMSKACSHGCIRLYLSDLNWMYVNIPVGTSVLTY